MGFWNNAFISVRYFFGGACAVSGESSDAVILSGADLFLPCGFSAKDSGLAGIAPLSALQDMDLVGGDDGGVGIGGWSLGRFYSG